MILLVGESPIIFVRIITHCIFIMRQIYRSSYKRNTTFPTCLPCQTYSTASSACSNGNTLSIRSSSCVCEADSASQKSSISIFEPALMPLCKSVNFSHFHYFPQHSPEVNPPINKSRHQLSQLRWILLPKISHLADHPAPTSASHTLDQGSRSSILHHQVHANTISKLHHLIIPLWCVLIINRQDSGTRIFLLNSLQLRITRRSHNHTQASRERQLQRKHADAPGP